MHHKSGKRRVLCLTQLVNSTENEEASAFHYADQYDEPSRKEKNITTIFRTSAVFY
jgi:hypothetical protein